jgi:2-methylcitrate dehydratase PrpD
MGSATDLVLDFTSTTAYEDLPQVGIDRAISAIGDAVAVAFAGSDTDVAQRFLNVYERTGLLAGEAPLIGTGLRSSVTDAAVFNGVVIHAMDFDDSVHPGPLHCCSVLLPALLGVSQLKPVSGKEFITSFLVGLEVAAKLALGMNPAHYRHGWHATSTIGTMGGAVAVSKLLGLNRDQTNDCLGNAASGACGLRANIGHMVKPLHAGSAARVSLLAGLLSQEKFSAAHDVLDDDLGYFAVFCEPSATVSDPLVDLGQTWEIASEFGIGLKPYPVCGEATAAVEASLVLREQGIDFRDIKQVRVASNARSHVILAFKHPKDLEQARFSMQFCVAAPLVTGVGSLATFSEDVLHDPMVQGVMSSVEHVISEEHRDEHEFGVIVDLELSGDRRHHVEIPLAKGWSNRFPSEDEQRKKFFDCCGDKTSAPVAELFELLQKLPALADIRELTDWLLRNVPER